MTLIFGEKLCLAKKVILVSLMVSSFALTTQAREFTSGDQTILTNLCMTALSGNRAVIPMLPQDAGFSWN
jgi:hypothetical protein